MWSKYVKNTLGFSPSSLSRSDNSTDIQVRLSVCGVLYNLNKDSDSLNEYSADWPGGDFVQ